MAWMGNALRPVGEQRVDGEVDVSIADSLGPARISTRFSRQVEKA